MIENEFKLIKQAQRGDAESFGALYDYYLPKIYRFAFLKTSSKTEAEDIAHDVFLSAWRNIESYNDQGYPFSSWLYQIARNKIIDSYRTKKQTIPLEGLNEAALLVKTTVGDDFDRNNDIQQMKSALGLLPEDQQNVLILRFIEDLSTAETAAAINKSEGAVRLIQHRAVVRLREILNKKDEGLI